MIEYNDDSTANPAPQSVQGDLRIIPQSKIVSIDLHVSPISFSLPTEATDGRPKDHELPVTSDSISGTWVRIQKLDDGSQLSIMKIITPTHFAAFQQDAAGNKQELFQVNSGRYTLENDLMNENYMFSSNPQIIGKTSTCRVTIEGDTLRQTWKSDDGETAVEVWTRDRTERTERKPNP